MNNTKLGVLDGGIHQRGVFAGESPTFLVPSRGASIRPERFDIIIIPFHTDQVFLSERRKELESFVDNGGVLLVLGACDIAGSNWIPFCQWTSDFTKETTIVSDSLAATNVFAGVDNPRFHTHWHAHGALIPLRPATTEILVRGEQNRPTMLLVKTEKGGAAVVTSLDPDYHSSPMVPGGNKRSTEEQRQNALCLLKNLIALSKELVSARGASVAWDVPVAQKVFLSHKGANKPLVHVYKTAMAALGYDTWLDEDVLAAGYELERGILNGMQESCGAIFFITPEFKDEKWLAKEIDYAVAQNNARGDGFALVAIVFSDDAGNTGAVPDRLKSRLVYKEPSSDLEALIEIVRALPVRPGQTVWR